MPTTPPPIADQLREAIKASGLSYREIAERADIAKPTIAAFMSRPDKDLNLATAEAIAKAIGMRINLRKA